MDTPLSLSQRIAADRDAQIMSEAEVQIMEEREAGVRRGRRIEIVTNQLVTVARSLHEPCEPLSPALDVPKYFILGDLVLSVHLFEVIDGDVTTDEPRLVVLQHCVSIVGIDRRSDTIETVRVGMLGWLRYESIYKALTNARSYMDFDMGGVKAKLADGQVVDHSPIGDGLVFPGEGDFPDDLTS